jgi:hypothetical protein
MWFGVRISEQELEFNLSCSKFNYKIALAVEPRQLALNVGFT